MNAPDRPQADWQAAKLRIPILMYHSIAEDCTSGFARFAVRPAEFAEQMRYLGSNGFTTLTVGKLGPILAGSSPCPVKAVAITFDDGFRDFIVSALPALDRNRLTSTLYVVSGLVGQSSAWLSAVGEGDKPLLGWSDIREVLKGGTEVGAHTMLHPPLDKISPQAARSEIVTSKRELENKLSVAVDTFAYPFGFENRLLRSMVRQEGYTSACAVRYANASRQDDRFALPRHIVPRGTSLATFAKIVSGRAPIISTTFNSLRSRGYGLIRPILYRMT